MRRQPSLTRYPGEPLQKQPRPGPTPPNWEGDSLEPFLVSGGATFFIRTAVPPTPFDPAPAGIQLVCSVYVPRGKIGFVKQLRVAPFMPTELADPWHTSGVTPAAAVPPTATSWRGFDASGAGPTRPGGQNGVWETPFGWESYFDSDTCGEQPPQWTWQLRLVRGNVMAKRPTFSLLDPATWYLVPDIAVPLNAYDAGIPGAAPSGHWGPQRMQVLQGDQLASHVVVPEDMTVCLFTQWTQNAFQSIALATSDGTIEVIEFGATVFPLLPSFGQLHGYMQAATREASQENAKFGWGG